jgi:hypothetical protein
MRSVLEDLRACTKALIAQNPTQIAVCRIARTDDGAGGWKSQKSDLPPFTGRLVASRRHAQVRDEAATLNIAEWVLIAPHDADLRHGANVEDTFEVAGKKHKVERVIPRKWRGETYSVHAILEEVS